MARIIGWNNGFAKVVTNLTPTEKDNKIFGWLDTMIDAIVPKYNKKK